MDLDWKVPTYQDGSRYRYFFRVPEPCTEFAPISPPVKGFYDPSFGDGPCLHSRLAPKQGPEVTVKTARNLDIIFRIPGWPDYPLYPGEPHGLIIKLGAETKRAARGETEIKFTDVLGEKLDLVISIEGSAFVGKTPLTESAPMVLPLRVIRT